MVLFFLSKVREQLFASNKEKVFFLALVGPSFLLFLSALGLVQHNPLQAGLLAWVPLLLFFFWTSSFFTFLLWVGMMVQSILLFSWGLVDSRLWLFSLHLSLLICYLVLQELKTILERRGKHANEHEKEIALWKSRFDTLHEKMREDQRVWEEEIENRERQLKDQEEVQQEKRKRTETLLGTNRKKAISLESIAKKVKSEQKK